MKDTILKALAFAASIIPCAPSTRIRCIALEKENTELRAMLHIKAKQLELAQGDLTMAKTFGSHAKAKFEAAKSHNAVLLRQLQAKPTFKGKGGV